MQITLTNTGKRFNRDWIFRHVNYKFLPGRSYAITGPNGSGKSTLLQVIAGALLHTEGTIAYAMSSAGSSKIPEPLNSAEAYRNLSLAAPYLKLIEEMTGVEMLKFHSTFKSLIKKIPQILTEVNLEAAAHKQIRYYSSGMKQRLKLAQAFFTESNVLLLDEPATNLDREGIQMYHSLIQNYTQHKLVIISSNDKEEYDFCNEILAMKDIKQ